MSAAAPQPVRVTPFQARVYAAVTRVPCGRVTTYARLAAAVGCGSARAVGQALRRNPFAPDVPCHRVIASDLTLGGFQGRREGAALARKERLLAAEGVLFGQGRLLDSGRLFYGVGEGGCSRLPTRRTSSCSGAVLQRKSATPAATHSSSISGCAV